MSTSLSEEICNVRYPFPSDSEDVMINIDDAGEDEEEGVLAILQDENGQQQTVRLTPDQAAALGIDYQQLVAAAAAGGVSSTDGDR